MDYFSASLDRHLETQGKIEVRSRMRLDSMNDLSLAYTPGVARPCEAISANPRSAWDLTWKGRTVAVVSDGSAVLGLGNLGGMASLPVMEGKAALFKEFAGVDAVPIVLATQDEAEIIDVVRSIAPATSTQTGPDEGLFKVSAVAMASRATGHQHDIRDRPRPGLKAGG